MKEKKDKNKECPLCEVSQDTLKKLKKGGREKKKGLLPKILVLVLLLALAGFTFYSFFSNFSSPEPTKEEGGVSLVDKSKTVEIGSPAPNFTSQDVYGNKISLSDFRNKKPILLVFWATWCGFCAQELPDLKTFTAKYKNEIQVITISSGEVKETVKNYIEKENVNFPMLLDENRKIWNQYLVRGTPSHFLINKKGEIITLRPGLASMNDLETMITMLPE